MYISNSESIGTCKNAEDVAILTGLKVGNTKNFPSFFVAHRYYVQGRVKVGLQFVWKVRFSCPSWFGSMDRALCCEPKG